MGRQAGSAQALKCFHEEGGAAQDRCRAESGDDWDEEEHYFVYEALSPALPGLTFTQLSPCAGLLTLPCPPLS